MVARVIRLHRAGWSQIRSHSLVGFDENKGFLRTAPVYVADEPNLYRTGGGVLVRVMSWWLDGSGYGREKK